ncbi:trans-aconitate 2-methyltransferase [Ideonella sp. A 288]|uniref:class I SAM-dependent methyltransferase n=1 Tax=Ideonella sp. A 288 TaxID=1962181 RepID=UPI001F40631A|nr:class I SAM-dependent methyltransferase [Ideonella sp. A 288]
MSTVPLPRRRLPWPLPALVAWATGWALFVVLRNQGVPVAALAATLAAVALAWAWGDTPWRKGLMGGGFPLSLMLSGLGAELPAAAWLLPLALLAWLYPLQAWRDAPMFPTPADALAGLAQATGLAPGARVLDAGCGLGHGLQALRRACPQAQVEGVERSWPLGLLARLRCPWARVRQGDMWREPWQGVTLVYLFQRPESMDRALAKAEAEMAPGAWLASLEFPVPSRRADAQLAGAAGRPVWLYRVGGAERKSSDRSTQSAAPAADKTPRTAVHRGPAKHNAE